jgi:hypothetical protein
MTVNRPRTLAAVAMLAAVLVCPLALAQTADQTTQGKDVNQLWEDFLHYIRVARPELAKSYGEAIIAAPVEPKEIYLLSVNTTGTSAALSQAEGLAGMPEIIVKIRQLIEQGHQQLREDPAEIARSIELLGGTVRGFKMGVRRLAESGEYALPQLIQKLREPSTPVTLRERITEALPKLGKDAVRPLSVALQSDDQALLEILCHALANIGYPHAGARLKELSTREGMLPRVKQAAETALIACAGQEAMGKTAAALFHDQAVSYYYQKPSVAPDTRYPTANVWYWSKDSGLTYKPVPREIFCDIYAMRMCRLALAHDSSFYPAVSLWLAANLKRQADLPEGATDPTYPEKAPSAEFFALASGAKYLQAVLARALNDRNAAVAKGAIVALAETAGAKNLVEPVAGGAQPLVEALTFPDRHVRFLAAVSLANALPEQRFTGFELVMPQLIQALRQTGQKRALVTIADESLRNGVKDALRAAGYDVIDDPDPTAAIGEAHKSVGVDVVVVASEPDPAQVVRMVRQDSLLSVVPVVAVGQTEALRGMMETDPLIIEVAPPVTAENMAVALNRAAELTGGAAMTPQEAGDWAVRSASAIEYLGVTANKVFDVTLAVGALASATDDTREEVRLAASRALSVMDEGDAQRAIAAVAVDQGNAENVRIAAFGDLSASLRRYGNQLTDDLAQQVLDVVKDTESASAELLNVAAQALGAMNLPTERVKTLIIETVN